MNSDYKEAIIIAVNNGVGLLEMRDMTVCFKADGLAQADAYNILEEVRTIFARQDKDKEDLVLELMDFVVGWCQVKYFIWDDVLKT